MFIFLKRKPSTTNAATACWAIAIQRKPLLDMRQVSAMAAVRAVYAQIFDDTLAHRTVHRQPIVVVAFALVA